MAIQAYSLAKEGDKQLSPHFRVREFRCRDGSDPIFVDDALVSILQKIREHFGKPLTITSGYRTPAHNKAAAALLTASICMAGRQTLRLQVWDRIRWPPMPSSCCPTGAASGCIRPRQVGPTAGYISIPGLRKAGGGGETNAVYS